MKLPNILPVPDRPVNISPNAQWLAGEGAGSWFLIEYGEMSNEFHVTRHSPDGMLECEGIFKADLQVQLNEDFTITYPSHCQKVSILQENELIQLLNVAS